MGVQRSEGAIQGATVVATQGRNTGQASLPLLRRRLLAVVGLPLAVLVGCAEPSPTAEWSTGKDILDSLKASGFSCEWSGPGEQVVLSEPFPLSGEATGSPTVRCDDYGVALIPSRELLLEVIARESRCAPVTEADLAGDAASLTVVLGENFVVVPNGTFPAIAQPEDFIKAFGGEAVPLFELYERACEPHEGSFAPSNAEFGEPRPDAAEGAAPPGGLVEIDGILTPAISIGEAGPALELWVDPQAPAASALAATSLLGIVSRADEGELQLILRPASFLDSQLGNDASLRAIAAAGCAMEQGLGAEFLVQVLVNQPSSGEGWTDEDLVSWGEDLGMNAGSLSSCVALGTYASWAQGTALAFDESGIAGVPYAELNGVEVPVTALVDLEEFDALVQSAAPQP